MNSKELHDLLLTRNPPDLASFCAGHETILRALRLLAAAEANDGSTPETDAEWRAMGDLARRLERERNGLAARVLELERGIAIATDRLTGPGGVLSAIDAARSKP